MNSELNLVSLTEAGARYKCHPRTLRRMIAREELTGYRVGPKLIRIDTAEADRVFSGVTA